MRFGKLAFMCSQNRHGKGLYPRSLAEKIAAAEQKGTLTKDSFPPGDQAQHLPRQYTEILQQWKGGSRLLFPLHKYRKLLLLLRQSHGREQRRERRYTHENDRPPFLFPQRSQSLTCSFWWLSTYCKGGSQNSPQSCGKLHLGCTPAVKASPK